jgi:ketosteroid isomerase-like protein
MSDPKDVVRRFFATLGTGDFHAVGEFLTDNIMRSRPVATLPPASPKPSAKAGSAGLMRWAQQRHKRLRPFRKATSPTASG